MGKKEKTTASIVDQKSLTQTVGLNSTTIIAKPEDEKIKTSYCIEKSEYPGDLYHLVTITTQGDKVLKVERDVENMKMIIADRIMSYLTQPAI